MLVIVVEIEHAKSAIKSGIVLLKGQIHAMTLIPIYRLF